MQIRQNRKLFGFESFVFLTFFHPLDLLAVIIQERGTRRDDLAEVDKCSVAPPLKSVAQFFSGGVRDSGIEATFLIYSKVKSDLVEQAPPFAISSCVY